MGELLTSAFKFTEGVKLADAKRAIVCTYLFSMIYI